MTTRQYCHGLLEQVERAGRDPQLAYLVRTRLRRALVALERGRSDAPGHRLMEGAASDIRELVTSLGARVAVMCQPSEALDVRWTHDWDEVLDDVARLRLWVASESALTE